VLSTRPGAARAALLFFALTTPLGIAAHLISELAGLGWHDDADVFLSARHGYLAALAAASIVGLLLALRNVPRRERRAYVGALVERLPFAYFAVSQMGEGCPLCGGDVVVGVFAAAVAAGIGALAVALGKRHLIEFALALVYVLVATCADRAAASALSRRRARRPAATRRTPFAFRYRPPPSVARPAL
jgi:hypothetical protein